MAIIQYQDELSRLPQNLLNLMVTKQTQEAQAEELKLRKQALALETEERTAKLEAFKQDRAAQAEAGIAFVQSILAENPELEKMLGGLSGGAAAIVAPQIQQNRAVEAGIRASDASTDVSLQRLQQDRDLFGLNERVLTAQAAQLEANTDLARGEARAREAEAAQALRVTARGVVQDEMRSFATMAQLMGNPQNAARMIWGDDVPPNPEDRSRTILDELQGAGGPEELVSQRLTRVVGVLNLPSKMATDLQQAFTVTSDPQEIINEIYAQEIDDATKSLLFGAVQSTFPGTPLSPPPEAVPALTRFWRTWRSSNAERIGRSR